MEIKAEIYENNVFLNLYDWDDLLMNTHIVKKKDVKNVLQSYSFFIHSIWLLENISQDINDYDSSEEIIEALQSLQS